MTDFFEDVGQIKAWMSSIRKNIGAIEEVYGHFITAVTSDQTKGSVIFVKKKKKKKKKKSLTHQTQFIYSQNQALNLMFLSTKPMI
jgi:hypothetical protein